MNILFIKDEPKLMTLSCSLTGYSIFGGLDSSRWTVSRVKDLNLGPRPRVGTKFP